MILLIPHGYLCLRGLLGTKTYPLKSNLFRIAASQLVSSSFYPFQVQIIIMCALTPAAAASLVLLHTLDLNLDIPITSVLLYLIQMSA